ncbi:PREDICTED: immediate early response 3-interacting protein 1 [Cyprinodon variegatus]|uniref:immediate early response 3-interacting protein 1 n=1 Tax=Cyprinodon variegatus TaxID=28743 RepID=UPI00074271B0|nr:PREDICTED: immediate early response 3-interacting protein 1 [Cyprinodon variegatus]
MAFTLYTLIQTAILCINAIAVLHEERFLSKMGWGADQGVGGFGDDPGVKAQILNLIRSVRTVMRGGASMASTTLQNCSVHLNK